MTTLYLFLPPFLNNGSTLSKLFFQLVTQSQWKLLTLKCWPSNSILGHEASSLSYFPFIDCQPSTLWRFPRFYHPHAAASNEHLHYCNVIILCTDISYILLVDSIYWMKVYYAGLLNRFFSVYVQLFMLEFMSLLEVFITWQAFTVQTRIFIARCFMTSVIFVVQMILKIYLHVV